MAKQEAAAAPGFRADVEQLDDRRFPDLSEGHANRLRVGRRASDSSHRPQSPKALDAIRALQRPNRPDVLASVLRKYLDNSRDSVEALRDALRANDPTALQAVAHRLKSSSAQLGALGLAARGKEFELMGASKNLIDADRVLLELQSEYATACTVFRNEIAKEKQP